MLYELFTWIEENWHWPGASLWGYVSFRAGTGMVFSLIISMLFGGRIIRFLRNLQVGEDIRDLGLEGQMQKKGTPTMGGVIIIMGIVIPVLLVADLTNIYIIVMLMVTTWMAIIGFTDDYIKVFQKNKKGLSGKAKVVGQVGCGLIVALTMLWNNEIVVRLDKETADEMKVETVGNPRLIADIKGDTIEMVNAKAFITNVPFMKGNELDYAKLLPFEREKDLKYAWLIFIPLVIIVITAVSNGANLTDGLDGLATGVSGVVGVTLAIFAYVSSNIILSNYLGVLYLPGTEELVIFAMCFLGACIGFLWYNAFPAQVFMGDTGSLTLGGIIATMAIMLRKELLIPVLCGVFLAENLSVMLQVSYFKYTKKKYGEGRRIFLMSPLHHHYQKKGMPEMKIVTRFWIVGILLAVVTILTLKIR
ncbi:MAG TPA: phospho-N-acetylmuramoyl-pentapeptide-transferase [Bacteroidetes bacterium]|nr:phospho-N-acetylmuramoyl-pentapeptide-transferase [Bacteroidota bacterium]